MCGGQGSRLDADVEKPLYRVAGTPMVERVLGALAESRVDTTFAVTSPAAPETAARLDCPCIETPGDGYVTDLQHALGDDRVSSPVLTVAADVPALDGDAVNSVLEAADGSMTVAVPVGRKHALGLSVDTAFRHGGRLVTPAGVNVVGDVRDDDGRDVDCEDEDKCADTADGTDGGDVLPTRDIRFAVNVNRPRDARRADWLLATDV